jgi:hypothetical protein
MDDEAKVGAGVAIMLIVAALGYLAYATGYEQGRGAGIIQALEAASKQK